MTAPTEPATPAPPRTPLYSTRGKLVIVALLAVAAGALALAVATTNTGGDDPVEVSGSVPLDGFGVQPRDGSEVLRQVEIGIDLLPGWEATLVVNGVEIPESELRIVGPENQTFFTPAPGRAVERLEPGRNCVTAIFWRSQTGRGAADGTHRWCFQAT
jgi:hypothetical protein